MFVNRNILFFFALVFLFFFNSKQCIIESCVEGFSFANLVNDHIPKNSQIKSIIDDEKFIKSKTDKAKYRYIKLKNGLKAFIVSKEDAVRSEVAISVDVGFNYDPPKIIGLSNLVQHSLLLASHKYPNIDEFHNFIKLLNGKIYLDLHERSTVYSFTIGTEYLSESIFRFSSYFHRPLLNNDSINKAMLTIFSHLNKIKRNEFWVRREIEREIFGKNKNVDTFYYGNKNTLLNNPNLAEGEIYEKVRHYFSKYYGPNNMKLALVGREPLEKLEKYVIQNFARIKSNGLNIVSVEDSYKYIVNPFIRISGNIITIRRLRKTEINTINLRFPIDLQVVNWRRVPTLYLKYLLDGNFKGILRKYLKSIGVFSPIKVGVVSYEGFSTLDISIDLYNNQLKHSWKVVKAIISTVKCLVEMPVSEKILLEAKKITDIIFNYRESEFTRDLAYNIVYKASEYKVKPHEIIYADEIMEIVDASFVKSFINSIKIEQVSIFFFTPSLSTKKIPSEYNVFRTNFYSKSYNTPSIDITPNGVESPGNKAQSGTQVILWFYNTIKHYLIKFLTFIFRKEIQTDDDSIKKEISTQDFEQEPDEINEENSFVKCSMVFKSKNLLSDYCINQFPSNFFKDIHNLTIYEIYNIYNLDIYTPNPYTPNDLSLIPNLDDTKTIPQPLILSIKKFLNNNIENLNNGELISLGRNFSKLELNSNHHISYRKKELNKDHFNHSELTKNTQKNLTDLEIENNNEISKKIDKDIEQGIKKVNIKRFDFYSNIIYFYYKNSAEQSFPETGVTIRIQTPKINSKIGSHPKVLKVIPKLVVAIEILCVLLKISLEDEIYNFRVAKNEFKISSFTDYTYNNLPNGFEIQLKGFYDVIPVFLRRFATHLSHPFNYFTTDMFREALNHMNSYLYQQVYFTPSITKTLLILRSITENQPLTPYDRLNELKYITYQDVAELSEFFARQGQIEGLFMNSIDPLEAGLIVNDFLDQLGRNIVVSGTISLTVNKRGVEIIDHKLLKNVFRRESEEYSIENMLVPISNAGKSYFNSYEVLDMTTLPLWLWKSYKFEYSSIDEEKSVSSLALLIGTKTPFTISLVTLLCIFLSDLLNEFLKRISNENDSVAAFTASHYSSLTFVVIQVESYSKDVASLSEFLIMFINEIFETPYIIEKNLFYKVRRDCINKFKNLPNKIELFSVLFLTFVEGSDFPFQWIEKVIHTMETLSYDRFIKSVKFLNMAPQIIIAVQSKISNRTHRIEKYVPKGFTMLNSTDDLLNQKNLYIYKLPINISRNVLSQEL
ncbi:secreted insulinase-like peptidase [Cryptosporidium ubiquitum]|uniref:Secreted insulinase-like peptidase n=1 Tax=Cryptosporidium ubiquitum TaxID=857276 RepID=A0A1J4MLQ0_9CRYT|nr:secreted insulinase-like peptidase [Cryptosporidium ubiquitum]OII74379.1 secreted insulinase-like peptidase [Cryptosporidium ubiquitum]